LSSVYGQPHSTTDLAGIWLGFLRFYLFDFQRSKCAVNIVRTHPMLHKGEGVSSSALVVIDPFEPTRNLCKSIGSCGFQFIFAQLMACYSYFGVPRLSNGRHLFTRVRAHDTSSQCSLAESTKREGAPDRTGNRKQSRNRQRHRTGPDQSNLLHLVPIIDDANDFESNLLKVHSLLTEKFTAERCTMTTDESVMPQTSDGLDLTYIVPLDRLLPHLLRIVLDEVLDSEDVSHIADRCLERLWRRLGPDTGIHTKISLADLQHICDLFAKQFWFSVCRKFINRGILTVPSSPFIKQTSFSLSQLVSNDDPKPTNTSFSPRSDQSFGEHSDTQDMPAEENYLSTGDLDDEDHETGAELDEYADHEHEGVGIMDEDDGSLNVARAPFLDETEDGAGEYAERTLDLGDEDEDEQIGNHGPEVASSTDKSTGLGDWERTTHASRTEMTETQTSMSKRSRPDGSNKGDDRGRNAGRNRKSTGPTLTAWASVTRIHYSTPLDDDRPGYYHSRLVDSLKPEDLSFPFTAWGQINRRGSHSVRSSVLGLGGSDQRSTMLAHFSPPEPQCKACGLMGHTKSTCQTSVDTSTSFAMWQKQCAEIRRMNMLHQVFATRFPNVQLKLFGSCCNGFELPSSDMDLCVFFPRESREWSSLRDAEGMLSTGDDVRSQLNLG
uniref:NTP_transf_2 domain-containing protein n=1 Tax=Echinostoma caproni TaxID=27848 RepID=A0A183ALL5_9TREM